MNKLQLRQQFVKESGRYDLVVDTTNWVDNGADFYLDAGQRYLERRLGIRKSVARMFQMLTAGQNYITFQYCRSILDVYIADTESRTRLEKKTIVELREDYASMPSDLDTGTPLYYTPAFLRPSPADPDLTTLAGYMDYMDILALPATSQVYDGVLVFPPPSGAFMIEVWGYFYDRVLTSDTDTNQYSELFPEVLLHCALYQLETMNRNSEGAKDWKLAIDDGLLTIDFDAAEEEASDVDCMEG